MNHILNGKYEIKFCTGSVWDDDSLRFSDSQCQKFLKMPTLSTTFDNVRTGWDVIGITIWPVPGGEAKTERIKPGEF